MIERHHDYILRPITLSALGSAVFTIRLDQDAPFALRSIVHGQLMNAFQFQIQGYDDRRYAAATKLNNVDSLLNPGTVFPVYPQVVFPAYGMVTITLNDLSGSGTTNGVLALRGVKLFKEGQVFGPQYPDKFTELWNHYVFNFTIAQGASLAVPNVLSSQPLNINSDADFVVRMASAFVQPGGDGYSVSGNDVILRDQYGKPYSSDSTGAGTPGWVPTHFLFPVPAAAQCVWPDATLYPEIYVKRNSQLLLDLRRTDGAAKNTMNFVLHGSKIFAL